MIVTALLPISLVNSSDTDFQWSKYSEYPLIGPREHIGAGISVIHDGSKFLLYYSASAEQGIGLATSFCGKEWTDQGDSPMSHDR